MTMREVIKLCTTKSISAPTTASQFPRVPMGAVNGLKSHAATKFTAVSAGSMREGQWGERSRAERRAARTGGGFQNRQKRFSPGPMNASSAAWSSPPSLQRSISLGKYLEAVRDIGERV